MGVQGLWSLVEPAARPVQLETLRNRKMAVDASIWIHQFMRTMRDKEGNALKNGHLLGFFRRLCKLLFYNIKPVFVFDGGAPTLKRSTIRGRRERREGIVMNLKRTAEKILSAQVKSRILYEEEKRRQPELPQDEARLEQMEKEAAVDKLKQKFQHDQYELPPIDDSVRPSTNDPRLATEEELIDFINTYHPSEQDIDTEAFKALPPEIQYEIVQDIKLKSRQTSWARLDEMIRNSRTALDFSKQQIKHLMHRNKMTQKMLEMDGFAKRDTEGVPSRIAGERGREYLLIKNEDASQGLGWKLPGTVHTETLSQEKKDEAVHDDSHLSVVSFPPQFVQTEDKVRDAVANNPRLAALFADFDSDNEEEEEEEDDTMELVSDDDEPLFIQPEQELPPTEFRPEDLLDDIRDYVEDDDEALQAVIQQIYSKEAQDATGAVVVSDRTVMDALPNVAIPLRLKDDPEDKVGTLSEKEMYDLWLSRVPDAFIYLHSVNDQYKKTLHETIYDYDIRQVEETLTRVQKAFGKTNERDEISQESLAFHEEFLKAVADWKRVQTTLTMVGENCFSDVVADDERPDIEATNTAHGAFPVKQENISTTPSHEIDPWSPESVDYVMEDDDDDEALVTIREYEQQVKYAIQNSSLLEDEDSEPNEKVRSPAIVIEEEELEEIDTNTFPVKKAMKVTAKEGIASACEPRTNSDMPLAADTVTQSPGETDIQTSGDGSDIGSTKDSTGQETILEDDQRDQSSAQGTVQTFVKEAAANQKDVPTEIVDYGYNSDEEITNNVEGEENEFARFVSDLSQKDIESVRKELYLDMKELNKQQRKEKGNTDEITNQMIQDIQELLRLFGIPFIISPMEAEAQCAELLRLALVEGVVTDDSDVFLFGGSKVYKNMFNNQKYVECYVASDIEREMQLDRSKLVQLAFLLGSDYTDGIPGVGPVAAMEILAEFTQEDDKIIETPLKRFREWYEGGKDATDFQRKFRKKHPSLDFPADFPSPLVIDAYYHPTVDDSKQAFAWGTPELDTLREFLMRSFSWSQQKADEVLIPVIKEMNKRKVEGQQSNISSFFSAAPVSSITSIPSKRRAHPSKRVQNVINKWRKQTGTDDDSTASADDEGASQKLATKIKRQKKRL